MITIPITFISVIYMLLLTIVYFSKERITNIENKLYANMIKLSCFGIIVDSMSCMLLINNYEQTLYFKIATLFMLVYYIMWSGLFLIYIFVISLKKPNMNDNDFDKKYLLLVKTIFYIYLICSITVVFLPLNYHIENGVVFPEGLSVSLTYFIAGFVSLTLMFVLLIINRKHIKSKKYAPLYSLIILLGITALIQNLNPGIILTTSVECFITFLMYFTVENPDVQLISELYKNKKLIEKSNEDISKFLFRITADLKKPVKDLIEISDDIKKMKTREEMLEANKYVNSGANNLDYLINKALNISTMDTGKIKIYETKYNVYNVFKEISFRALEEIKNPVEFNFSMGFSIPHYLYGDSIKLKQIVMSIIRLAYKDTTDGFINLDVSSLIKYDICRLIITIEDSGNGMSIDKVNEILSVSSNKDLLIEDNQNLDIFQVKKIVSILGGSFMIKSDEGKGTTVIITLDQKVVPTTEKAIAQRLENYEQTLYSNRRVLLIDDDEEELNKITRLLKSFDIEVTASMFESAAIEKICNKNKYDFIILDDELINKSALTLLNEFKQNKNFKIPVIVMINDNKEGIKLQYLKDGFADTILKSKLETEIKRIVTRF